MATLIQFKNKKGKTIQVKADVIVIEGDYLVAYRGKCNCYKNTCSCVSEQYIHKNNVIGTFQLLRR